jgi:selenocysteine lyase/cysteine desulfurase
MKDIDGTKFGRDLKEKHFLLDENLINLNHGSFGTIPKSVALSQYNSVLEQESHPDKWFREKVTVYINKSRSLLSEFLKVDIDDLVIVENASSAVNSILRSLDLKKGDKILRLSTAYGMVISTLDWLASTIGVEIVVVPVEFPVENNLEIENSVKNALIANPTTKLCIFSHISSMPTMIEPVEELTKIAKSFNCLVMIDGAHVKNTLFCLLYLFFFMVCHAVLYFLLIYFILIIQYFYFLSFNVVRSYLDIIKAKK